MTTDSRPMRVLIAGGGTGGHLFPGIAVAQEIMKRNAASKVLFVNAGKPFEQAVLARAGFAQVTIPAEGIKGRRLRQKLQAVRKVPAGITRSLKIVSRFKPDIVVGLGSYASGAVVLAGWLLGKKIVLFEQNRLPGMTNRILMYLAHRCYVAFPGTREGMKRKGVLFTGNPVRKTLLTATGAAKAHGGKFTVLVIGGSQGAHAINVAVTRALSFLAEKERFHFIHQTGAADAAWVRNVYAASRVSATVAPFFEDMEKQYAAADWVVCRSGATTVAELTALGKPALFIPFPFAADNHQMFNARELAEAGAADVIFQESLDPGALAEKIWHYADHPEVLSRMAARAKAFGRPDAAVAIVNDMARLVRGRREKGRTRLKGRKGAS